MWQGQELAQVVELVDTLSWGGSGDSRAGSSPALGTILVTLEVGVVM